MVGAVLVRGRCNRCREADATRPGGFCAPCWRKEGRPGGKTAQLRAIRKAVRWDKPEPPTDPLVRLYWDLKQSNPKDFLAQLERLDREFEAGKVKPVSEEAGKEAEKPVETDSVTSEVILPLCDRLLEEALAAASEAVAGRKK